MLPFFRMLQQPNVQNFKIEILYKFSRKSKSEKKIFDLIVMVFYGSTVKVRARCF